MCGPASYGQSWLTNTLHWEIRDRGFQARGGSSRRALGTGWLSTQLYSNTVEMLYKQESYPRHVLAGTNGVRPKSVD